MTGFRWQTLGAAVLCTCAAHAQDADFQRIPLRLVATRPDGTATVDRGQRDGLQIGDRVLLQPRDGREVAGNVVAVAERTAEITLADPGIALPPGTRGEWLLPRGRMPAGPPAANPPQQPGAQQPVPPPRDDGWRPGMPLLSGTKPPRPEDRHTTVTGRAFVAGDLVHTLDTFSHSYLRSGADVEVDNLDHDGGTLRMNGEFSLLTESNAQPGADLRLYELSYAHGGDRYHPLRLQAGRFLQHDMPEFGILDGIEVGYRRENGDRCGGSFGFLPELDEDLQSFEDLQLAGWYLWSDTLAERFSFGLGYQKTWHSFATDRDLLVAKVRYLPLTGWDFAASTWIDVYYGGDQKHSGPGLTRAYAQASRHWDQDASLQFAWDHEEYPDQNRDDTQQTLLPATVLDAHQDRLTGSGRFPLGEVLRGHARLSGWVDESDGGGAVEFGAAQTDLLQAGAATGLTLLDVQGAYSSMFGLRLDHGGNLAWGRLDVLYELAWVHHDGFPGDRDDMLQHRLGALCSRQVGDGWDLTFHLDATLWDSEFSLAAGFYLQKFF